MKTNIFLKFKKEKNLHNDILVQELEPIEPFIEKTTSRKNKLIEIKDIHISFGKKKVLDGISFNINKNEDIALIGSNGAGKSTLIEMIMRLNKPSLGTIKYFLKNDDVNSSLGIQFQNINFPSSLTVKDIINFVIKLYKIKISDEELLSLIDNFKIKAFYNSKGAKLSGGQKQRVNVMLSLIHKPEVVFLDEFSAGLDFLIKNQLENFLKDYFKKYGITLILISHDIYEIEKFAKRIIVLERGKIILDISKTKAIELFGSIENLLLKYIR